MSELANGLKVRHSGTTRVDPQDRLQKVVPSEELKTRDTHTVHERFRYFARRASDHLGSPWAFLGACLIVLMWAVAGPVFSFSDTWQMVINTGTTIVTFLMVFLIQHAQNHDARAMQLKLDELLRAVEAARTGLVNLEERSEEELIELKQEFGALSQVQRHLPNDDRYPMPAPLTPLALLSADQE